MHEERSTVVSAESPNSFEEAIRLGVDKATEKIGPVHNAYIREQKVVVRNGHVTGYAVDLRVTYAGTD